MKKIIYLFEILKQSRINPFYNIPYISLSFHILV